MLYHNSFVWLDMQDMLQVGIETLLTLSIRYLTPKLSSLSA